jgi:hypothetical protein
MDQYEQKQNSHIIYCIAHTKFNLNPLSDIKNGQTDTNSPFCFHFIHLHTTHKMDP